MRASKGSVLCVDDEPNILRSLHWMLHKDYDVRTAPDAASALEMLGTIDFDVIVSDQRMPGMSGSEFLRQACEVAPRAMRILLTGYSDMQAILQSINEGEVFRFVNKPWSNEELCRVVGEACQIAKTQPLPVPMPAPSQAAETDNPGLLLIDEDPAMATMLGELFAGSTRLHHVHSMTEAVAVLDTGNIGVIVSELKVGDADVTPLLKLLKQSNPHIVTVVVTRDADVDAAIKLINQGQVYRFITKPLRTGFLKLLVGSALQKHRTLKQAPGATGRHAVEKTPEGMKEALLHHIQQEATRLAPTARHTGPNWAERIRGGLRRLFTPA